MRLRSLLFVPAHKPDWVPKATAVGPDAVILDLEDAVPAEAKAAARAGLAETVAATQAAGAAAIVRVNPLTTPGGAHDLAAAVDAGADAVMVPKVDSAREVDRLDAALGVLERLADRSDGATRLIPTLESAAGLLDAAAIAGAPRVIGVFAAAARDGDTARSVGFRWTPAGTETLAWRTQVVLAARAAGVTPIAGLWQEVADLDGLAAWARGNRDVGFGGAAVIHPSHVAVANREFSPSEAELAYYRGLLDAVTQAEAAGSGAVMYQGDHVDAAHVATARAVVAAAEGG